ncbi:MAG: hypothetical protein AB201_01955 [Parcubacteria bacterium C7867-006]|nr:MAG: hypothetical protein AB201_01955 [Parcubacteria bacterium C7867-006]
MKDKRYKRMTKAIIAGASSGIVAGMILMGTSNVALAETADLSLPGYYQNAGDTGMHMMRKWNTPKGVNALAGGLGLTREEIRQELKSGKTMKQIMQEHGIDTTNLHKGFRGGKMGGR